MVRQERVVVRLIRGCAGQLGLPSLGPSFVVVYARVKALSQLCSGQRQLQAIDHLFPVLR
jgi:hypothetical protein